VREALVALGWKVVTHQGRAEALQSVEASSRVATLIALGVLLVAALAAALIAQFLARPILRLTEAAARVSSGELNTRVPVETGDEIGTLARTFNQMTGQLRDLVGTLEQRVTERTRALNTSVEVSRRLSTVLDPRQLVVEVVEQVKEAFGYYHAHVYLFDEARQSLLMVGGTGEAGRSMLARGHKIPAGRGLVGRAAAAGQIVLVADTAQDPGWLPNPLLPETRSEVAVPILVAGQVVGVLDVQHKLAGGLTPADAELLQSIANQVGIALQNARAYEQTQRQARRETLINTIGQRLQKATSVEAVLEIAAHELSEALDARRALAQLGAPANGNGHAADRQA
jgi:nitrate/nitrite-specific signal transduction histidine kinase